MQSDQIDKLAEALAKAQGAIKNPVKNRKVTVTTRTGGRYEFKYADLTAIIDAIKGPLADNNIGYVQFVEEDQTSGKYRLITKLIHNSGQWIESRNPLFLTKQKDRDGNELPPGSQEFGSAQTFMKRYALAGMVGVSADEDDDANIAEGNVAEQQDVKRKPKPPEASIVKEPKMPINQKQAVSPREMPPMAGGDWVTWGRELLDAIQIADPDDRTQWLALNKQRIGEMCEKAPKVFLRFSTALENLKIDKDLIDSLRPKA